MGYLDDFNADDAAFGVVGGFLLPTSAILVGWYSNISLNYIFSFSSVLVFFIGFVLGSTASYGWREDLHFLLPIAVLPVITGFLFRRCHGKCVASYRYFYSISLGLVFTSYLAIILYRNKETFIEFLKGAKGGIHRDINWSLEIGIVYFSVFLILNTMIRWTAVLDSLSSSLTYIIFSLGLIPTAGISVWLYLRENLKTPILMHIPWVAFWSSFILGKAEHIPLGEFYTYSYILPTTDYASTWPMLLSLVLVSGLVEIKLKNNKMSAREIYRIFLK